MLVYLVSTSKSYSYKKGEVVAFSDTSVSDTDMLNRIPYQKGVTHLIKLDTFRISRTFLLINTAPKSSENYRHQS